MFTTKITERIVGVLFIIASAAPILTFPVFDLLTDTDYLIQVAANENQVLGGLFLEVIWALAVVGIPVMLFPILKKQNEALALGFFSLRFMEGIIVIIGSIGLLTLLTLSQEFVQAGAPDASSYQIFGTLLLATRDWVFIIGSGLVWSLSALLLNYVLFQSKLVPRWLSGWGLVGATLSFATYLLQVFSINITDIIFAPIAIQEMAFAVWLIVKGFNSSVIASEL